MMAQHLTPSSRCQGLPAARTDGRLAAVPSTMPGLGRAGRQTIALTAGAATSGAADSMRAGAMRGGHLPADRAPRRGHRRADRKPREPRRARGPKGRWSTALIVRGSGHRKAPLTEACCSGTAPRQCTGRPCASAGDLASRAGDISDRQWMELVRPNRGVKVRRWRGSAQLNWWCPKAGTVVRQLLHCAPRRFCCDVGEADPFRCSMSHKCDTRHAGGPCSILDHAGCGKSPFVVASLRFARHHFAGDGRGNLAPALRSKP